MSGFSRTWRQRDDLMVSAKVTEVTIGVSFETTRWSLVVAAGSGDSSAARAALATLCETYWYPLYAYVRRRGTSADDARDLTQGFFTSLLERRDFEHLRQERGRFRAFLLASLQHFLANDAARRRTQKRGGGMTFLPLAFDEAEGRYRIEPAESSTPETLFERRWALTVIDRVLGECGASGRRMGVRRNSTSSNHACWASIRPEATRRSPHGSKRVKAR